MKIPKIDDLKNRHFPFGDHPYHHLEARVADLVTRDSTILDIGCGRTAPNLVKWKGKARHLIGVDLVDFDIIDPSLELYKCNVVAMPQIADNSVDIAYSRSVMEHIEKPREALAEIARVLKPGGNYVFLTPNFWDYASLFAFFTPNKWHARIVRATEGRDEQDTFPTFYRCNTHSRVFQLANETGFSIEVFQYMGQYPSYFSFNRTLFYIATQYELMLRSIPYLSFLKGWIFCIVKKSN